MTHIVSSLCLLTVIASSAMVANSDWPGWMGPNRDGKSLDTGLLKQWPAKGPRLLWKVDGIGVGFSSVAVTGGKIYITGDRDGKLTISAFDLDGKPLTNSRRAIRPTVRPPHTSTATSSGPTAMAEAVSA
jgi:hypothetical protein